MSCLDYSAVLSLVGSRELSRNNPKRYSEWIVHFQKVTASAASNDCNIKFYYLGDYLYLDSNSLEDIVNTVVYICSELLEERVYLKVVIAEGCSGLDPIPLVIDTAKNNSESEMLKKNLFGVRFTHNSYHLRPDIEELKSIACNISIDQNTLQQKKIEFFHNLSMHSNSNRFSKIKDIKTNQDSLHYDDLVNITEDFIYFSSFSKSLAKYFIPLYINICNTLKTSKQPNEREFLTTLCSDNFFKVGLNIIGFEYVIFSIFDTIAQKYKESEEEQLGNLLTDCQKNIFKRAKLRTYIHELPTFILSSSNKQKLLLDHAVYKSKTFRKGKPED